MQYPFNPKLHKVPAAVIYCLDPRFAKQTLRFIQEELDIDNFDQYVHPGGLRVLIQETTRDIFLGAIEKVSIGLHNIGQIVLIAHRDCGAYGGSKAFPNPEAEKTAQEKDLKVARGILREKFSSLEIKMYYLEIIGNNIEFQEIR